MNSGAGVTIVMPCYKQEHYLFRAIASSLWQMAPNDELVVVHDWPAPLDRSWLGTADPRVTVLENGENKGVSFSRNRAIRHAKTEWVKFLDADDVLAPYALNVVRGPTPIPPSTIVITGGMHRMFDGEYGDYLCADEQTLQEFDIRNPTLPSLTFARRSALLELGLFNEQIDHEEDWDLWFRIRERFGLAAFQIVNQPICYYWLHDAEREQKRRTASIGGQYVREYFRDRYGANPE